MGALNLPSASDLERLTRRVRSVSQRLEGIEDGLDRLERPPRARRGSQRASRSGWPKIEAALERLEATAGGPPAPAPSRHGQPAAPEADSSAPSAASGQRRPSALARRRCSCSGVDPPPRRQHRSETISTERGRERRAGRPSANSVAVSISTASAPAAQPALLRAARAVVEEIGGDDRTAGARRPAPARRARRQQLRGRRRRASPAPSARLVPSAASASVATAARRAPASASSAPQVPTRSSVRAPELGELGDHDRGAGAAHAGALDRQRPAVGGRRPCTPTARGCG